MGFASRLALKYFIKAPYPRLYHCSIFIINVQDNFWILENLWVEERLKLLEGICKYLSSNACELGAEWKYLLDHKGTPSLEIRYHLQPPNYSKNYPLQFMFFSIVQFDFLCYSTNCPLISSWSTSLHAQPTTCFTSYGLVLHSDLLNSHSLNLPDCHHKIYFKNGVLKSGKTQFKYIYFLVPAN